MDIPTSSEAVGDTVQANDVQITAQAMIEKYPRDAAVRAIMRADTLCVLGYIEKAARWRRIEEAIGNLTAGRSKDAA